MEKRLGLGLDALLGSRKTGTQTIKLSQIEPANWQPRKNFDEEGIKELSESIKIHGVIQPILVQKDGDKYKIIAGERRWQASKMANLESIPSIVVNYHKSEALEVSMIENLQRRDLNPIEKAEGFAFLIDNLNLSQEELAKRLGLSRAFITNTLRLRKLPDSIKEKIITGKISPGHAKALLKHEDAEGIAEKIIEKKLSVREVEKLSSKKEDSKAPKSLKSEVLRFEEMISEALKTKCEINLEKTSGSINLKFESLEQLEKIISDICF